MVEPGAQRGSEPRSVAGVSSGDMSARLKRFLDCKCDAAVLVIFRRNQSVLGLVQ